MARPIRDDISLDLQEFPTSYEQYYPDCADLCGLVSATHEPNENMSGQDCRFAARKALSQIVGVIITIFLFVLLCKNRNTSVKNTVLQNHSLLPCIPVIVKTQVLCCIHTSLSSFIKSIGHYVGIVSIK